MDGETGFEVDGGTGVEVEGGTGFEVEGGTGVEVEGDEGLRGFEYVFESPLRKHSPTGCELTT